MFDGGVVSPASNGAHAVTIADQPQRRLLSGDRQRSVNYRDRAHSRPNSFEARPLGAWLRNL